ncbi:MAG: hypothetical protein K6G90_14555 [Clostridia bacterium]|nr:hypothetical protein [Clostridia bacterium]
MTIAVPYDNMGNVPVNFGSANTFKIYEIGEDGVARSGLVFRFGMNKKLSAAELLKDAGADTVVCNKIKAGERKALEDAGFTVDSGFEGNGDCVAREFLAKR